MTKDEAARLTRENGDLTLQVNRLLKDNADLQRRLEALERSETNPQKSDTRTPNRETKGADRDTKPPFPGTTIGTRADGHKEFSFETEHLFDAFKARLIEEAPALLRLLVERPELEVSVERRVISAEGDSTLGRVARLIKADFLADSQRFRDILKELERTGTRVNNKSLSIALQDLVVAGFLTKESVDRYRAVPDMKIRVVEAA